VVLVSNEPISRLFWAVYFPEVAADGDSYVETIPFFFISRRKSPAVDRYLFGPSEYSQSQASDNGQ